MSTATETKTALRGGEFLIKDSTWEDIYIPEEITEEQKMMRDMTKDFIRTEIDPNLDKLDHDPMLGIVKFISTLGTS